MRGRENRRARNNKLKLTTPCGYGIDSRTRGPRSWCSTSRLIASNISGYLAVKDIVSELKKKENTPKSLRNRGRKWWRGATHVVASSVGYANSSAKATSVWSCRFTLPIADASPPLRASAGWPTAINLTMMLCGRMKSSSSSSTRCSSLFSPGEYLQSGKSVR